MKRPHSEQTHRQSALGISKRIAFAACTGVLTSTLAWAGPPESSGKVVRLTFENEGAVYFFDGDRSHFIGLDPYEICSTGNFDAIDDLDVQAVVIGGDPERVIVKEAVLDAYAGVYEGDLVGSGNPAEICANFSGPVAPVAEGTVNYRYLDNNIWWGNDCESDVSPSHTNAWGEGWNGVLTDSFGQPAPYVGMYRATWQSCDPSTWKETFQLRLKTSNGS